MSLPLTPSAAHAAFETVLISHLWCSEEDDGLRVDTPYVLQDGRAFRVFLRPADDGSGIVASDDGYAASQIELFSPSMAARRERFRSLVRIAKEFELQWDFEFSFLAPDLDAAARRVVVLARAVDKSLTLVRSRVIRAHRSVRQQLEGEFRGAGLKFDRRVELFLGPSLEKVVLDYRVEDHGPAAAIKVLDTRSRTGLVSAVNRTATDFQVMAGYDHPDRRIAVYDEASPMDGHLVQRLRVASPQGTLILPSHRTDEIISALAS